MKKISIGIVGIGVVAIVAGGTFVALNSNKASSPPSSGSSENKAASEPPPDPKKHSYMDIDFARKMIIYNQQATELANLVQHGGGDVAVLVLAKEVATTHGQTAERYAKFVTGWGETYTNLSDFPQTDGHDAYPTSPGLATAYELANMTDMPKAEKEKEFVRLILKHHQGAVEYAKTMGDTLQYGELKDYLKTDTDHYNKEIKSINELQKTKGY